MSEKEKALYANELRKLSDECLKLTLSQAEKIVRGYGADLRMAACRGLTFHSFDYLDGVSIKAFEMLGYKIRKGYLGIIVNWGSDDELPDVKLNLSNLPDVEKIKSKKFVVKEEPDLPDNAHRLLTDLPDFRDES